MSKQGQKEIMEAIKTEWESIYFNVKRLEPMEWVSSERTFKIRERSNGGRTLYHMIIAEHAKERRYEIGQGDIRILTTIPEEIEGIEKSIGDIGLVKFIKEKYNLEIEQIRTTSINGCKREIEVVFLENDDEGCVAGDNILKEEDRLNLKWR